MKNKNYLLLFFIVLALHITGIAAGIQWLEQACKPLLVLLLAIYFHAETKPLLSPLKKWIIAALAFSWLGDVLLQFQGKDSLFFLLGLSAFLIAHIFYILFFHFVRMKEAIKSNTIFLVIVVIYYTALIILLSPSLGEMKLPVRIYGIIISIMFMLALHMLSLGDKKTGRYMAIGAAMFVLSDSLLAVNKFYQQFEAASILVMLTYGLAQWLIVEGAIRYIRSAA